MRICIDVSQAVYGTGVGDYTKNLVTHLLRVDSENEYVLFGGALRRRGELQQLFPPTKNSTLKSFIFPPTSADIFWNNLHTLPIEKFVGNIDLLHSSDWTQPPTCAFKITTIHDLAPLRYPQYTPKKILDVHKKRLAWVAKEVDRIIAVSSFTKQEAVELLGINPEKIVVIPEAGDERICPVGFDEVERVVKKFMIPGKYLLVVGTNPRKNLPKIVEAFDKIRVNHKLSLVVVGRKPQGNFGKDVIFTGFTGFEDLSALYSGAAALVYTSLYEGFGQPILEAMKVGCPVITSNTSSLPEVAGDAAVLVNPTKTEEIVDGIKEVVRNREKWAKKGRQRAKEFSWEDTVKLTLRVYQEALK